MRLIRSLLVTAAFLLPVAATASSLHRPTPAQKSPMPGNVLANRMARALARQSRIQVRGSIGAPGQRPTQYLFRYQSPGREWLTITGGAFPQIQVGKRRLAGMSIVSVGTATFRTVDGTHWTHVSGAPAPSSLDALGLNAAHVPCCFASGSNSHIHLVNRGLSGQERHATYLLSFRRAAAGQLITGSVRVDRSSFLPVTYTETSQPPVAHGSFTITYGGSFSIAAPR